MPPIWPVIQRIIFPLLLLVAVMITLPNTSAAWRPHNWILLLQDSIPVDSIPPIPVDSAAIAALDTLKQSEPPSSAIKVPIAYQAEDSITIFVPDRKIKLYHNGQVNYQNNLLESERINLDWSDQTMVAWTPPDSTGEQRKQTVYTLEDVQYYSKSIAYNFQNNRIIAKGIVTKENDSFLHGEKVAILEKEEIVYIQQASYTTCNKADPHFSFHARKAKLVRGKHVITGPFNVRVDKTDLPLGFLFGYFLQPGKKRSGLLTPSYGEERNRGFFLREFGYYFAISDYMDLRLSADAYTKGSHKVEGLWNYIKRYGYTGRVNLRYSFTKSGLIGEETKTQDVWVAMTHQTTGSGTARFSASINGGTSTFTQNNLVDVNNNSQTEFNSNVNYSQRYGTSPFTSNLSLRHRQNIERKTVSLNLPDFSLNMAQVYPLQRVTKNPRSAWNRFGVTYRFQFSNRVSNEIPNLGVLPIEKENFSTIFRNSQNGIRQTASLSLPITVLQHFILSNNFNYTEWWYFNSLQHSIDGTTNRVAVDTVGGFARAGSFQISSSLSTQVFGTFVFKGKRKIQAIRHTFRPTFSLNYNPDFSKPFWGAYTTLNGPNDTEIVRSRFEGFVFGGPSAGSNGSLGIQLSNQLEMKVRDKTAEDKFNKVPLLSSTSISTRYNFLADEFQLSPIQISANSQHPKIGSASFRATLDPYLWRAADNPRGEVRTNTFAWSKGQFGRITQWTLSLNTSFSGNATTKKEFPDTEAGRKLKQHFEENKSQYVDFDVPWTLQLGYNINYTRVNLTQENYVQSITANGDVRLLPSLKVNFSTGYDITQKEFTQTSLSFVKNLHCWELVGSWIPFGRFTSYEVTFRAKASALQGLQLNQRRNFFDNL